MKGSNFIFECVHLFYYKCHKINVKRCGLYLDSTDWIKSKKKQQWCKIDTKWFQYAVTIILNYVTIGGHLERIIKIKSSTKKYNWEWRYY